MLSADALRLLRECAMVRGDRCDVEQGLATWLTCTFTSVWRVLAMAVVRGLRDAKADWRAEAVGMVCCMCRLPQVGDW